MIAFTFNDFNLPLIFVNGLIQAYYADKLLIEMRDLIILRLFTTFLLIWTGLLHVQALQNPPGIDSFEGLTKIFTGWQVEVYIKLYKYEVSFLLPIRCLNLTVLWSASKAL